MIEIYGTVEGARRDNVSFGVIAL